MAHVAELAGVSLATVSRVINRPGNVHPETVKTVRAAMQKVNYEVQPRRPGRQVGSAQMPSEVLAAFAMVVPEVSRGLYWSLQQGFAATANDLHHQVIVCNTKNEVHRQGDEILQLLCKRVAGVAIVSVTSAPTPPAHVEALQNAGVPVVVLHRAIEGADAPLINLPLHEIARAGGKAALDSGHRRIAFMSALESQSARLHEAGFRQVLGEAGLDLPESLCVRLRLPSAYTTAELEAAAHAKLAELWALPPDQRPTAIYTTIDGVAEVAYLTLIQMGLRVPQDVSLISFGDAYREGSLTSRLTSIVVDEAEVGSKAVRLLVEMRRRKRPIRDRQEFPVALSLSDGETLGTPPE